MRVFVQKWRFSGINAVIYLDDLIVIAESQDKCQHDISTIICDLDRAGFVISVNKSILRPTQELDFLGFHLNSKLYINIHPSGKTSQYSGLFAITA